ncbi:hypothetical protein [uncultured Microscilla sp.]|uniref:hypothetical protein n=1 Tax=uncultured Microscilla sp. TaxID=432653 RepID=UPI00262BD4A9|nr:hypothetical protein [uncultured Microscilla sp.]
MEMLATQDEKMKIAEYWITGAITAPSEVQGKLKQMKELQQQIETLQNKKLHLLEEIIQEAEQF